MNRGINRQEARLGMSMTDLQSVCVCVLSFSTSGLPSGESGSAAKKKHPAHPVEHTHKHKHTVKYK